MKVLVASNLDSRQPFGQFTRPYFLGSGMTEAGMDVANVGVDCSRVDFGPTWSVGRASLSRFVRALATAIGSFQPDVVYAHQNLPATAAILAARRIPVAVDFHSIPSVEWLGLARDASGRDLPGYVAAAAKARVAERFIAGRTDLVIAASVRMSEEVARRYAPRRAPIAVPNGVEGGLLEAPSTRSTPFPAGGVNALATLPADASPSNRRALDFLIEASRSLDGSTPAPLVHVLGTAHGPTAPAVRYHGFQADLRPWIDRADVCLLPYPRRAMLYGGAKNKLLEYLARGRAIVTTAEGLRGLEEAADWPGVWVADDEPTEFASAMCAAAEAAAPSLDSGRDLVRRHLRWDVLAGRVIEALGPLAERSSPA